MFSILEYSYRIKKYEEIHFRFKPGIKRGTAEKEASTLPTAQRIPKECKCQLRLYRNLMKYILKLVAMDSI